MNKDFIEAVKEVSRKYNLKYDVVKFIDFVPDEYIENLMGELIHDFNYSIELANRKWGVNLTSKDVEEIKKQLNISM